MQAYKLLIPTLFIFTLTIYSSTASTVNLNSEYQCNNSEVLKQQMLELINKARADNRSCSGQFFSGTNPISWNDKLASAAQLHSDDMSSNNFFSHTGSNGLQVSSRVLDTGYNWQTVAENIYAGARDAAIAIKGWLGSPGHCKNIMNPSFKEMGAACSHITNSLYGTYYTQVFATGQ